MGCTGRLFSSRSSQSGRCGEEKKGCLGGIRPEKKDAGKSGPPCDDAALEYSLVTLLRSCLDRAAARELSKTEPPSEEPLKYKRNGFVWNQDDPRIVVMMREKERFASKLKVKERRDCGNCWPMKRK